MTLAFDDLSGLYLALREGNDLSNRCENPNPVPCRRHRPTRRRPGARPSAAVALFASLLFTSPSDNRRRSRLRGTSVGLGPQPGFGGFPFYDKLPRTEPLPYQEHRGVHADRLALGEKRTYRDGLPPDFRRLPVPSTPSSLTARMARFRAASSKSRRGLWDCMVKHV
jgi:hypothetical protein